MPNIFVRF